MILGLESPKSILNRLGTVPPVFDQDRAVRTLADLKASLPADPSDETARALEQVLTDPRAQQLLTSVFSNAPYLARTALRNGPFLPQLLLDAPEDVLDRILRDVAVHAQAATKITDVMVVLRRAKMKAALLTAVADLAGVWDVFEVTAALTRFADVCLQSSLRWLLSEAARDGTIEPKDAAHPEVGSGLFVIAMGKYGAHELNYSSDIDITIFFDDAIMPLSPDIEPQQFAVRLTKTVVKMMQEITGDGYVFRVDLRLRPDAGATAVALSTSAAEQYYESLGQNWERAAMIKARVAVGDLSAGERFLRGLSPFIWRKNLDFATIEDIHSIKRQIHRHGGAKPIGVAGHNVKLGLGGIREIEFFVQTQQLIVGGRYPNLRNRTTCGALDDLAKHGMFDSKTAEELKDSYKFLRMVEHRLQMREDMQTQEIPKRAEDIDNIARFSGFEDTTDFEAILIGHLTRVNGHYNALFAEAETLGSEYGNLVFTGVDDDPETLETLAEMGFSRPGNVAEMIRRWHFGRMRATRSQRARALLTKLVPVILDVVAKTPDPDVTFSRFDAFLGGLPAGVQLFSLFSSHKELFSLLINALGTAPRLGPYLAQNSGVLDALLDADFMGSLPSQGELEAEFGDLLKGIGDFESTLDESRRWGKDHGFRIGMQVLQGILKAEAAGRAYADLAEVVIRGLAPKALDEVARTHGHIADSTYAVVAMGKLGGRELTATSDVDLIYVYDYPSELPESDGARPTPGPRYFTRAAQRLIAALSAPTAEGVLYKVDMQLRPSGKAGPIATQFASFGRYYEQEAWTWEKMALTRARVVAGTGDLATHIGHEIRAVLCARRDTAALAKDVTDMRERMVRERGSDNVWQLKQVRGGLVDLEFICQFLQLAHAADAAEILDQNTSQAFRKMKAAGVLDAKLAQRLINATELMHNLTQVVRIAVDGPSDLQNVGDSLGSLLCRTGGVGNMDQLTDLLRATQLDVLSAYKTIVEAAC